MKKKYYMIGNAHLDPVWMWHWQEGCAEAKATMRSALDRMNENPDFKFVCSSASIYAWVEECAPEMMEEIRQRVKEGRWIVVGGWWVQPDCNLPSGEGFARQSLYSQRYFQNTLGTTAKVGYCVDSFGHNRMLPQILKKSGMDDYIMMRPSPEELGLEHNLFQWEAPDGSRVAVCRIPDPYCFNMTSMEMLENRLRFLGEHHEEDGKDGALFMYGVGNHGGGPTIRNIELIHEYQKTHTDTELVFAAPGEFFDSVDRASLPVWKDDLQHHASGCYAATSRIKTEIRKSETRLLAAEKFTALANKIAGIPYNTKRFEDAWRNVCFIHFHDIAGGCAIAGSYEDSDEFAGEALSVAAKTENAALQAISWKIDTRDREKGLPIVLFNSLSYDVETDVVINTQAGGITDTDGNFIPFQHVHSEVSACYGRPDTLFRAKIPALGYTTYYLKTTEASGNVRAKGSVLKAYDNILENKYIRVSFDMETGYITSIYDKVRECECLGAPAAVPVVIDENEHDTWSHAKNIFGKVIGKFTADEVKIKENGKVRVTMRVHSTWGNSSMRADYSLSDGDRQLTVKVTLDWHERHRMLKLAYPLKTTERTDAFYQIPYGWIKRPCNAEEEPGQMWVSIQDDRSGIALCNDRKYSFSADGNILYLTAIRSPIYGDHGRERDEDNVFTDQGENRFVYSVVPYAATADFSAITRMAEILNTRPSVILENNHNGTLDATYTGMRISSASVNATAVKRAEDGNGWIVRLCETGDKEETVSVDMKLFDRAFTVTMKPFEVKTMRLADNGDVEEVLLTEYAK